MLFHRFIPALVPLLLLGVVGAHAEPVAAGEGDPGEVSAEAVRRSEPSAQWHPYPETPPSWSRIFMRGSGPASIAVALPDGQNYCWDAGACRLRYVWRGGFLDPAPHWNANGDGFAEVRGTIYYRAAPYFPLRFGDAKRVPTEVHFRGYNIVEGLPEFHYQVDGVDVRELIKSAHHGGVDATFKVTGARGSVYFASDLNGGATITSDAGKFIDGLLKLPAKTKEFTVSFTEILNKEPAGYWSMDDVLAEKKPLPVPGVKGRALIFDGTKSEFDTGLKVGALGQGLTFCIWVQLSNPPASDQACIGASGKNGEFELGANLAGVSGYGVRVKNAAQEAKVIAAVPAEADGNWHHLAATLSSKTLHFYFDGKPTGTGASVALPADAEFFLGSSGGVHFAGGTLDEARIYARVLDAKEIAEVYDSERPKVFPPSAQKPAPEPAAAPAPKATPKPRTKTAK